MFKLKITNEYSEYYKKHVFVARYSTSTGSGFSVGRTRKEAVLNAANSLLDEDDEIAELLEAVYDAGTGDIIGSSS